MNAFMTFSNEHRQDVRDENPSLKMTEIASLLGQMWRDLSDDEKDEYRSECK